MQMRAGGLACVSGIGNALPLGYGFADCGNGAAKVGVKCDVIVVVGKAHEIAVSATKSRGNYRAVFWCKDGCACGNCNVYAVMKFAAACHGVVSYARRRRNSAVGGCLPKRRGW